MAYPSVYPTSADSYTTKTDLVNSVMAVDVNELQSAIVAIETLLGTGGNITLATTKWIGLGASAGRIVFTDAATDTVAFGNCDVGFDNLSPDKKLAFTGNLFGFENDGSNNYHFVANAYYDGGWKISSSGYGYDATSLQLGGATAIINTYRGSAVGEAITWNQALAITDTYFEYKGILATGNLILSNSQTNVSQGDVFGTLSFKNYDASTNYSGVVASIDGIADSPYGGGGAKPGGAIVFSVNNTATPPSVAAAAKITCLSNLLVGTTTDFAAGSGHVKVAGGLSVGGDNSGVASHNSLTNVSNTAANSTGVGTIKFKGTTNRDSTGFIKIYVGTTAYYVPFFDAITG